MFPPLIKSFSFILLLKVRIGTPGATGRSGVFYFTR